ncbi:MAG: hypothetical protein WHV26_10420 [Spirochaetota bacterium]
MSIIELHNDVRAVIADGAFAMLLITGTDKVRSGYGNGDSLLVDFEHRVFAVADATERFPHASRLLLSNIVNGLHTIPQSSEEWSNYLNSIYANQEYHLKSTLSMIALQKQDHASRAFIAHGGDSSLQIYNRHNKSLVYKTSVNMNFAGRSKQIDSVDCIQLHDQLRIILYSDGFHDIIKYCGIVLDDVLGVPLMEAITHIIDTVGNLNSKEYDDISLLIFDIPEIYTVNSKGILMGGTTRLQEQKVKESISIHDYNSLIRIM